MSREVQIITWCDACPDEERAEATEYSALNAAGARVTIDLCDGHAEEYITPLVDLLDAHGRTESKAPRAHRKTTAAPGPCPECAKEFTSAQSLGMHRWRKHGVPSQHRKEQKVS